MTLREWRTSKGLSQAEAGALCGWDQARWSRYENGAQKPTGANLQRLLQVTEGAVSLAEIFAATPAQQVAPESGGTSDRATVEG